MYHPNFLTVPSFTFFTCLVASYDDDKCHKIEGLHGNPKNKPHCWGEINKQQQVNTIIIQSERKKGTVFPSFYSSWIISHSFMLMESDLWVKGPYLYSISIRTRCQSMNAY